MNIFAEIELIKDFAFKKVKYYSIRFEESSNNEFIDFLERMENETEYEEDMTNLFHWIEIIGESEGAKEKYFRNEAYLSDTSALPPPYRIMNYHELIVNNIRLYCFRLNEHVVFLFNGGIKTANKAQDCPNISGYFKQANLLVKKINNLFQEQEILWTDNYTDINFDHELRIEL